MGFFLCISYFAVELKHGIVIKEILNNLISLKPWINEEVSSLLFMALLLFKTLMLSPLCITTVMDRILNYPLPSIYFLHVYTSFSLSITIYLLNF